MEELEALEAAFDSLDAPPGPPLPPPPADFNWRNSTADMDMPRPRSAGKLINMCKPELSRVLLCCTNALV